MAEVAGLVIGAVALASTFKDCISLLSYIGAAKTMNYDYEILVTKLDIEKTLLLQWADRVRLFRTDYDTRLDDPVVGSGISQALKLVSSALGDSEKLRALYGIHDAMLGNDELDETSPISALSHRRMARFEVVIRTRNYTTASSTAKKIRWVIQHREKFEKLIELVSYCVSKLNELTPTPGSDLPTVIKNDLDGVDSLRELKLLLEASRELEPEIAIITEKEIEERCKQQILDKLWFRKMDERKDMINKPCSRSLHWSLEPPSEEVEWDDLSAWLQSSSDIYWISGKAGSGKSTLVKYLFAHQKTASLLGLWGGTGTVIIAGFFLYELGTAEQKSPEGLYRALLYYILEAEPALIPILLPGMWKESRYTEKKGIDLPSMIEMRAAFSRLTEESVTTNKFCFFIDGLDECSGDCRDIILFIHNLVMSDNIKIIVSSRPLAEFEDAFSSKPKLRLQDLNKGDMKEYISEFLMAYEYIKYLLKTDGERIKTLAETLIEMSSGMFLWLVLACRSLHNGLTKFDLIEDLESRIYELPPELNDMFKHMLGRIDKRDQRRAAKLLRICYINNLRSRPEGAPEIKALGMAIAMKFEFDHTKIIPFKDMSIGEQTHLCQIFERRLKNQCYGLIEIRKRGLLLSSISFIHRSLFEFLSFPETWDLDCLQIEATYFKPNMILSAISLRMLYEATIQAPGDQDYKSAVGEFVYNAQRADAESDGEILPHIFALENVLAAARRREKWKCRELYVPYESNKGKPSAITLPLAVEVQLVNAISDLDPTQKQQYPLLYHFFRRPYLTSFGCAVPKTTNSIRKGIVNALLSSGCDPNEEFYDATGQFLTPVLDGENSKLRLQL